MSAQLERRLADVAAAVANDAPGAAEIERRPAHLLSDAECADAWRRVCQRRTAAPARVRAAERAEILELWRELTA